MRFEAASIELRARSPWEAADLGLRMVQRWWRPIFAVWLALALPLFALLHLLFRDQLWLAITLFWWLKPALDRGVLAVVATAVFDVPPTLRAALAATRDARRPGLVWALTLGRLDPGRSFHLPIWQLEKQRGKARRARIRALRGPSAGAAIGLTLACLHLEAALYLSLGGLVAWLAPQPDGFDWTSLLFDTATETGAWAWAWNVFYLVAVSAIEPFYVAAGFALYLNRRTELEAWDLELRLRRIANRLGSATLAGLLVTVALWPAPPAHAQQDAESLFETTAEALRCGRDGPLITKPADRFQEAAQSVLDDATFGRCHRATGWHARDGEVDLDDAGDYAAWLESVGLWVARIGEWLLWIGVAALAAWLAIQLRRRWRPLRRAGPTPADAVPDFMTRPLRDLPPDIVTAARAALATGDIRRALALLFGGAIVRLARRGYALDSATTEREARAAIRAQGPQTLADYVDGLAAGFQRAAWAHRPVGPDEVRRLIDSWSAQVDAT
ncbi:MAG: DUF4129 domain-containing protein [Chromatiales bacterium]|nr:DUF4129 domain-containing protein [Chromatiales bacterium]